MGGVASNLGGLRQGYRLQGRRKHQEPWWRQTAAINYLSATLKDILEAARERRWKSGRRGWRGGDRYAEDSYYESERCGYQYSGTETGDVQVGK